jgi:hypothetical protein
MSRKKVMKKQTSCEKKSIDRCIVAVGVKNADRRRSPAVRPEFEKVHEFHFYFSPSILHTTKGTTLGKTFAFLFFPILDTQ